MAQYMHNRHAMHIVADPPNARWTLNLLLSEGFTEAASGLAQVGGKRLGSDFPGFGSWREKAFRDLTLSVRGSGCYVARFSGISSLWLMGVLTYEFNREGNESEKERWWFDYMVMFCILGDLLI